MTNKYRAVYIFTGPNVDDCGCINVKSIDHRKFQYPKTLQEVNEYLTKLADESKEEIYFAFRKNGVIWKVYKSGEDDFLNLINDINTRNGDYIKGTNRDYST